MIKLNHDTTAPSFDHPLEMLHACHGKILQQCATLQKLGPHISEHGCDEAAKQAATAILRYFDTAGMFHHQDEELDLFPALLESAGAHSAQLEVLLEQLLSEHVVMLSAWNELRTTLLKLADGVYAPLPDELIEIFSSSHTEHIATEETQLLPLAERLLDADMLQQLGKNMARRRISG